MNRHLKAISTIVQQSKKLDADEKRAARKALTNIEDVFQSNNKELKIERSLEKVRAVAMKMKKPADLPLVCQVLYSELRHLGFSELRNAMVNIHNDEKKTFVNYDYSDEIGKSITPLYYDIHPVIKKQIKQIRRADDAFSETVFKGKDLESWKAFRKSRGEKADKRIKNIKALYYYFYSIGSGSIGISTFDAIGEEKLELLKRFRNVFAFAYRRYMDVAQAEAQAREVQIELALERVRARTMAMQRSDELSETSLLLFQQFKELGEASEQISIGIFDEDKNIMELYSTLYGSQWKEPVKVDLDEPVAMKKIHVAWKESKKKSFVIDLAGNELLKYNAYRKKLSNLDFREKRWVIHIAFFSKGVLTFSATNPQPDETVQLLERFASVFEGTYTRFLDLKQAEAQARESQIQLALERVRARTMAMQKSEEIQDTTLVLFRQFKDLGATAAQASICIFDNEVKNGEMYLTLKGEKIDRSFTMELDKEVFVMSKARNAFHDKQKNFSVTITGKNLQDYNQWRNTLVGMKRWDESDAILKQSWHVYGVFFSRGMIGISSDSSPSAEAQKILERFASVFDGTYTRFLDLKQAEAQAREAQIEVSLERVRSKTMAMHNSQDVADTVATMFDEWVKLGIKTFRCGIGILEDREQMEVWTARPGTDKKVALAVGRINMSIHPLLQGAYNGWKSKQETFTYELKGDDIRKYFMAINNHIDYPVKYDISNMPSKIYHRDFYFPEGTLFVFSLEELSAETSKVLKRFAGVLGQTYRRFLDLQKAEAQAREAQIEASLERVRAKAMAMHNSSDLSEAAGTVFTELNRLGINPIRTGFVLLTKDSRKAKLYPATSFDKENTISFTGEFEFTGHPVFEKQYESWQKKENYFPVLEGEVLKSYYKILSEGLSVPYQNFPTDKKQFGSFLPFTEGFLFTWSEEPYSEKEINILNRFKVILDLTIRRYHDLQKAEAQTREAKIEAALERVRSKAMAMHKSDDLNAAVAIVFEELDKLNFGMLRCGIGILSKEKRCADVWTTTVAEQGLVVQVSGDESIDIHPLLQGAFDAWLSQGEFSYVLQGDDMSDYYGAVRKTNFQLPESQIMVEHEIELKHFYYGTAFESGMLFAFRETDFSDEAKAVMKRFAGVFNLTYKRFLDIQKAEAQAIEAQLQKQLIENKHREITENISYALRIQTAILPAEKLVKEYLQNAFVLYLPKDVVAGDFYWMARVDEVILFSANDCTGHGVSGAMVSVICHNALNMAIREYNLTQPSLILDKVAELVEENFTQSEDKIQDGMDTSLCAYFPQQRKLQWAGANNPLWIVRNNEIIEYKPDKQPIGKYENRKPFTNHEIELQEGDNIYIFSDGYQDQFGGEKGKKLTKKGLRNILLSIQNKNMQEQHVALFNYHHQWKGKEEQVDDICVIGVGV